MIHRHRKHSLKRGFPFPPGPDQWPDPLPNPKPCLPLRRSEVARDSLPPKFALHLEHPQSPVDEGTTSSALPHLPPPSFQSIPTWAKSVTEKSSTP